MWPNVYCQNNKLAAIIYLSQTTIIKFDHLVKDLPDT